MKALLGVVGFLVVLYGFSQVGFAQEKSWLVRSKNASSKVQFTLFEDGSIQRVNRGDPATTFDQSENRQHGKGHDKKKKKTEEVEILNITSWSIRSQGGEHTAYTVTYVSPTNGTADQVIVTYNLVEGTVLSAVRQTTTIVTEIPSLDGLTNVWGSRFIKEDGTGVELYANQDRTKTVTLEYDASGNFVQAKVYTQETLSLSTTTIPPYCTQSYGCTNGT